jgi:AcrR family transcriptional regulator
MRVKTEAKRGEILAAAAAEFGEHGFHEATLTGVARRIGSSKATIYNYFPSKGELFDAGADVDASVRGFARASLAMQCNPRAVAVMRLLVAEADRSPETVRAQLPDADNPFMPEFLSRITAAQACGLLRAGEPLTLFRHLCALLQGDLPLRLLFGAMPMPDAAEIDAAADAAADCFFAAYGVPR